MVFIPPNLEIPDHELTFETSRSSGPGGQNVNKVETRVVLVFDLAGSPSLTESQRTRLQQRLANRLTKDGMLRIASDRHRSQLANRREVVERLIELFQEGLRVARPRRATRPSLGARRRRLEQKDQRGKVKQLRQRPPTDD